MYELFSLTWEPSRRFHPQQFAYQHSDSNFSNYVGSVWIEAVRRPAKKVMLTEPYMRVWMNTKYLVRLALRNFPSSIRRQYFGQQSAAKSAGK